MFLDVTLRRNPRLIDTALELHQKREISPNTFVIDIDQVVRNASIIKGAADRLGLRLHVMTKQHGRNPFVALAARHAGIRTAVAVDMSEARLLHRHGVELGHVGHLVQVPAAETAAALAMRPEAITVFSIEAARRVSAAAVAAGVLQPLLLRVWKEGDFIYPGQEGGFRLDDLEAAASTIRDLPGVSIDGATSFPCLMWDEQGQEVRATGNLDSVLAAIALLRGRLSLSAPQVNTPAVTTTATLPMLAERGSTHGEPGSALTASTPLHAASDQPEIPAMVYVSEVSAVDRDAAYCFGGGFYTRSRLSRALLVGRDGQRQLTDAPQLPPEVIDYYGRILPNDRHRARVGDSVVFAFRAQVFVGRCHVAAVRGIGTANARVMPICDQHGNVLGPDLLPVGGATAKRVVDDEWHSYLAERS